VCRIEQSEGVTLAKVDDETLRKRVDFTIDRFIVTGNGRPDN
jgi:hypothetical protein